MKRYFANVYFLSLSLFIVCILFFSVCLGSDDAVLSFERIAAVFSSSEMIPLIFAIVSFVLLVLRQFAKRLVFLREKNFFTVNAIIAVILLSIFNVQTLHGQLEQKKEFVEQYSRGELADYSHVRYFEHMKYFARSCQRASSKKYSADLITDWDISRDPGMFYHRFLSFHLYPIDLRGVRGEEKNSVIIFSKKDALLSLPEGYKIIFQPNRQDLFAIKK